MAEIMPAAVRIFTPHPTAGSGEHAAPVLDYTVLLQCAIVLSCNILFCLILSACLGCGTVYFSRLAFTYSSEPTHFAITVATNLQCAGQPCFVNHFQRECRQEGQQGYDRRQTLALNPLIARAGHSLFQHYFQSKNECVVQMTSPLKINGLPLRTRASFRYNYSKDSPADEVPISL